MTPEECAVVLDRGWEMSGAYSLEVHATAATHLRRLAKLERLLDRVTKDGVRLTIGYDDVAPEGEQAFCSLDFPPPDDHGPCEDAPTPIEACLLLEDRLKNA